MGPLFLSIELVEVCIEDVLEERNGSCCLCGR